MKLKIMVVFITLIVIAGTGLSVHLLIRDGIHVSHESIGHLVGALILIPFWLCLLFVGRNSLFRQIKHKRSN
jgi:hypothetical protein